MRRAIRRHDGAEDPVVSSSKDVRTRHDKRRSKGTARPRVLRERVSKRQMSRRKHVPGVDGRRRPLCAEHRAALSAAHKARFARLGHGWPEGSSYGVHPGAAQENVGRAQGRSPPASEGAAVYLILVTFVRGSKTYEMMYADYDQAC